MADRVTIREMTAEDFGPLMRTHAKAVFADDHSYRLNDVLSRSEQEQIDKLQARMGDPLRLYLGAFDDKDRFIGWSWGAQQSRTTFYMVNSGVLPDHRRKGGYAALLAAALKRVTAQGFQLIYSRHNATNNAVIIPKLKAGFVISKLEMDDTYGVLVHLHFYTNAIRRRVMDYRAGQIAPNEDIARLFKT